MKKNNFNDVTEKVSKFRQFLDDLWECFKKIWLPITIAITALSIHKRKEQKTEIKELSKEISNEQKLIEENAKELEKIEEEVLNSMEDLDNIKSLQNERNKAVSEFLPGVNKS